MNKPESTPPAALSNDEKRALIKAAEQKRVLDEEQSKLDAQWERHQLVERFERELGGKEGQQFAICDATHLGEGFFVVKLGPAILMKTFFDSEMNDVDRCDFVAPCIVHPSKEAYLAARERRNGFDIELSNRLAGLYGLKLKVNEGK